MGLKWSNRVWVNDDLTISRLGGGGFAVLLCLADRANDKTGVCWPSRRNLARRIGLSQRQVQRLIQKLISLGCIRIIRPGRGPGVTNRYQLTIAESDADSAIECQKGRHPAPKKGDTHVSLTLKEPSRAEKPRGPTAQRGIFRPPEERTVSRDEREGERRLWPEADGRLIPSLATRENPYASQQKGTKPMNLPHDPLVAAVSLLAEARVEPRDLRFAIAQAVADEPKHEPMLAKLCKAVRKGHRGTKDPAAYITGHLTKAGLKWEMPEPDIDDVDSERTA